MHILICTVPLLLLKLSLIVNRNISVSAFSSFISKQCLKDHLYWWQWASQGPNQDSSEDGRRLDKCR